MIFVEPVYWVLLCLCWGLLVLQLLRREETAEKSDSAQPPDFVPVLLGLALIAARWPTLLLNQQLNPDESQLIAATLGFMHDPVPWRGADVNTSGPFNSYVLLVPVVL